MATSRDIQARAEERLQSTWARYLFGLVMVALALALKFFWAGVTGNSSSFLVLFAATLVTSLFAGTGPGLSVLLLSMLIGGYLFVRHNAAPPVAGFLQSLLFSVDGAVILYVTALTNRRRDEAERSTARIKDLIELAPDPFFLTDSHGRYIDVNQAACRMLGYTHDELVGMNILQIIPAEDAPRLEDARQEVLKLGNVHSGEWNLRRKDGTYVPVDVSSNMLSDGRWQGFARDITERKRVEAQRQQLLAREHEARRQAEWANAQLRESEERFRLTIDDAPIGMALVDLDGKFVRVNRVMCEITGFTAEELATRGFQDITHPDDVNADVDIAEQLTSGRIPRYQFEKRYIRKDKSVVDAMLSVSILRGADQTPRYFITQVEDITERKRAEHALRLSEAKFSGIVSIAADAIVSVDAQQRITVFNAGAEKTFGYSAGEIIGSQLERLIPPRFREVHRKDFERFAAGGQPARPISNRLEVFGLRKNGEEFPAEASILKVTVGPETFFSAVLRDVTDRKNAEAALQRALTARDDVLRIVAHDLRNPLSAIMMQASVMEREGPGPERRDQQPRQVILRAATRMNQLIQDLLDVALAEAGQLRISPTRVPVADLVRDEAEMEEPIATSAGLTLRFEIKEGAIDVWGDRQRLLQVFENLIGNAIKFTKPSGEIVVTAARSGDAVLFSVHDTGIGIAREIADHLFDRFWQVASKTKHLGAGLGLPITKGIVEAHGGKIWLESTPGHGSTFCFTIPVAPHGPTAQPTHRTRRKKRDTRSTRPH